MHPLILVAFVLSGVSGLTLEIVWTRMLEHVFGATTLAISTVLTCFMGGMALGSWLLGRFADRLRDTLSLYAAAEGIVGLCALVIPLLIRDFYPDLNSWMVANMGNSFWLYSLVRFAAVAAVLIVPTTCMGATLPLLSRHVVRHRGHMLRVGSRIGTLFTLNTFGAVGGVFLATFALLPGVGLATTNAVAGGTNIALCIAVLALRRRMTRAAAPASDDEERDVEIATAVEGFREFEPRPVERGVALWGFFLSGLAAMNLQVVWNRAMAMIIGSSVYSFALVLLAFLIGLAGGAALMSRWSKRIRDPVVALALVELAIAACAAANYLYMDDLPRTFATLVTGHIEAYEQHVGLVQFLMFGVAALAVLPSTLGMGATFPLTVRIAARGLGSVGRDVGGVYALNTLGSICGSFLSAFVFIPLFSRTFDGAGMQVSFFLSVGIYAALGLALLVLSRLRRIARAAAAAATVGLAALFLGGAPGWDPAEMTIGVFRLSLMEDALDEESWGAPDIKYYYDGVTTTVSIELWGRHFALKNNGKVDASNGDDMPTQIMIAAYPLLLHPRGPEDLDVAIVGFGSGVTVGSALQFPIEHVDVVELESAVISASTVFGSMEGEPADPEFAVNHLVYRRPRDPSSGEPSPEYDPGDPDTFVIEERLTIHNNDGRNFLAASPEKYDVIVSEPSNPWITGVSNMFTVEAFRSSAEALEPDGIFAQWVQLYELSPENIKTIFRTFASVFPHVAAFSCEDLSSDTVLLGSFSPIDLDLSRVRAAMNDPRVAAELERAYVLSPTDALARVLLVDREELIGYTDGRGRPPGERLPVNTDDNALIEFSAPHDLISFRSFAGYLATIYTEKWRFGRISRELSGLSPGREGARELAEMALSLLSNGRKREADACLELAAERAEGDPAVRHVARVASLLGGDGGAPFPEIERPAPEPGLSEAQAAELERKVADVNRSLRLGAHRDALERSKRIPRHLRDRGGPQMMLLEGYLQFLNADPEDSEHCERSVEILEQLVVDHAHYSARHPEIHYYLGLCHDNALHFDKAVKNVRAYARIVDEIEQRARIALAQARADMEGRLEGRSGTMPIELPPDPPGAPTTDAPGESPKGLREPDSRP